MGLEFGYDECYFSKNYKKYKAKKNLYVLCFVIFSLLPFLCRGVS